jgi:hypothetical protein
MSFTAKIKVFTIQRSQENTVNVEVSIFTLTVFMAIPADSILAITTATNSNI